MLDKVLDFYPRLDPRLEKIQDPTRDKTRDQTRDPRPDFNRSGCGIPFRNNYRNNPFEPHHFNPFAVCTISILEFDNNIIRPATSSYLFKDLLFKLDNEDVLF